MCDMQNMPTQDDGSCEEDSEMNWNTFTTISGGTHFVTSGGQLPVTKIQQSPNNGTQLPQVVGVVGGVNMADGVQYIRTLEGPSLQTTPQLITVPINLPGTKPGDPQPTVQIQVLTPNLLQQQQQTKYQMQIPIQGFQQGGAVITVAYTPEPNDGVQLLGNALPDGVQVLAPLPQDMQIIDNKEQNTQQQMFVTQNQQVIINQNEIMKDMKLNNNNNDLEEIVIKKEEYDINDDEDSQSTENSESQVFNPQQDLVKYLYTLPPQQTQGLPVSLQQFLRLNPDVKKNAEKMEAEANTIEVDEEPKKKKKYKKKPPRPVRPKPGQVVIATSEEGTPIYCCPECQNAYVDKEQLESHLASHQIERRFICGICGAGLKRKEHLERHKMGHNPERPYVCSVCGKGFKRREHLNLHVVIHSGVKTERCPECGKGFYRKDHLRKHTRSHETKRARDEANGELDLKAPPPNTTATTTNLMPEITIHVPTSNMQVPVQINIPQHIMTSLAQERTDSGGSGTIDSQLDALLAQHT